MTRGGDTQSLLRRETEEKEDHVDSSKRPWGVALLVILLFIAVVSYVILGILAIAAPGTLRTVLVGLSPQGSGPEMLLNLGPVLGVYFVVMAVVVGLVGYGLWTLRNWARIIVMVITALSLLATVAGLVQVLSEINLSTALLGLFRLGLSVLVLWYLWTTNVRVAFRRGS